MYWKFAHAVCSDTADPLIVGTWTEKHLEGFSSVAFTIDKKREFEKIMRIYIYIYIFIYCQEPCSLVA